MGAKKNNNGHTRPYKFLAAGSTVNNYKIISRIGRGGMGEVYLAEHTDLNRKTALKFLLPEICEDEVCRSRFKREAQASARLDHSNIATIYDVDEYEGRPFFTMQYIEGKQLNDYFNSNRLTFEEPINIFIQISEGLHYAHQSGIIHRDIKPSNILIDKSGTAKIFDFGLAAIQGTEKLTEPGTVMGTIGYMSPEQLQQEKVDHRTDIFSLGVLMYEIIAGRPPFQGDSRPALINSIINDTPEPLSRFKSNVSERLEQIVSKLLQKDPDLRYQSANEVVSDLKLLQSEKMSVGRKSNRVLSSPLTKYILGLILTGAIVVSLISPSTRNSILNWMGIHDVPVNKHLAVLPFKGMESEESARNLNAGMLEIMTAKLSQLEAFHGTLQVIPASEIRHNNIRSAREARRAFGATMAITGSMHILNDSVRVFLNLIDAEKERQLRSAEINKSISELSSLQDSALFELARMLEIQLRPEDKSFLSAGGTKSPEAYHFYLEGIGVMREVGNPEKLDSAIHLLNRAIETDDNFALAYADLGRAYWNKYRFVKDSAWVNFAEENCRQAIQINPNCAKAHNTLGNIYSEFRNFEKAIDQFESALSIDSSDTTAYRGLARVFEMQNNHTEAESIYKKAISIRPDYPRAYFDLAWFYIKHARMQDARLLTQKILSLNPRGFKDLNNLGALYYYLGKYERANEIWNQSLQVQPNYGAYSNLGALYFNQSRYEDAAGMYEKALAINDSDYRVWMNLAGAYGRMKSDNSSDSLACMKAIQMAEIQKAVNPDDPVLLSHLAEAYASMQMHDKAIDHIERALLIEPDNVNYYVSAGIVYESAKLREEAVKWIKKALENGVPAQRIKNVPEFDSLISDPVIDQYMMAGENNTDK